MRKVYITFGGAVYDSVTKYIVTNAPLLGAGEVWVYDDVWLTKHEFYRQNRWLWEHRHKRGFGWYSWKPLIILDALSRLNDGDIVLFTDADTYPIRDISILYNICAKEGAMFFEVTGEPNIKWCKRDCYIVMGQDEKRYHDSQAAVARFMLFKKGEWRSAQLLMEWLSYCVNPLANTFDPSVLGKTELPSFVEHRCEQAILTLLAHKYGYKLYREACELGESNPADQDLYPQLFSQKNPWNDKNGKNITAPADGSRYRNVPMPDSERRMAEPAGAGTQKSSWAAAKLLKLKNEAAVRCRKFISRNAPTGIKKIVKKMLGEPFAEDQK